MKFKELAKKYLESPEFAKLEKTSKSMYTLYVNRLVEMGGDLPVADTRSEDVARSRSPQSTLAKLWFDRVTEYKTEGIAGTTSVKNTLVTVLRVVYGWAIPRGFLLPSENPAPWVPRLKHDVRQHKPYKPKEIETILNGAKDGTLSEYLKPYAYFMAFAFYSACRPDEMYKHESKWFTKEGGEIYYEVHDAKGKAKDSVSRLVKLLGIEREIIEWFKSQPKAMGFEKYTFRTSNGHKFSQSLVDSNSKEVCRLLNVVPRGFYNTRRGMATAMRDVGYGPQDIADKLGNTLAVAKKYINQDMIAKANGFTGLQTPNLV